MNEPLSMLDYGLWRTEIELRRYFIEVDQVFISTRYDWSQNRILIDVLLSKIPARLQRLTPEKQCKDVVSSIRNYFGVDTNTGKPGSELGYTLLGNSFIHNGFKGSDIAQKSLFEHLDQITYIKVSLARSNKKVTGNTPSKNNLNVCQSPLLTN